jgi:hypothetical protein
MEFRFSIVHGYSFDQYDYAMERSKKNKSSIL